MPRTILVVGDDEDVRRLICTYLATQNYGVLEARNGDEAIGALASNAPIDLLLTDIAMPGARDGFALSADARRLRPGLKVLHVTGYVDRAETKPGLMESGRLLLKPFRAPELLERVARLLGQWAVDSNPVLLDAYTYWRAKAVGRRLPDRKDLDPAHLARILPNLSIVEPVGGANPMRFRCRLAGTRIVDAFGFNPVGRFLDDFLAGDHAACMLAQLATVMHMAQPLYVASAFRDEGVATERILLPYALGGDEVRQIVVVQTFDWQQRKITIHELAGSRHVGVVERPPALVS